MYTITLRVALALAAIASALAVAAPAQAGPATPATQAGVVAGDGHGDRFRFRDRGRFPRVNPFLFRRSLFGSPFYGGFGHGFYGGFDRRCDIFLELGDVHSYVLCRVGQVDDLRAVARAFLMAVHAGCHAPVVAVARDLGLSRGAASRRLRAARDAGLLPNSRRGRGLPDGHWPRTAQWRLSGGRPPWTACTTCLHPWPCPTPDTITWLNRMERDDG